jgi:hypothetical protein
VERGLQNCGGSIFGVFGNQIKSELIHKVYYAIVKSIKLSSENTVNSLIKFLSDTKCNVAEVAKL